MCIVLIKGSIINWVLLFYSTLCKSVHTGNDENSQLYPGVWLDTVACPADGVFMSGCGSLAGRG